MKSSRSPAKARLYFDSRYGEPTFYQRPHGIIRRRYYAVCQYNFDLDDCFIVAVCTTEASAKAELNKRGVKEHFISIFHISNASTLKPIEIASVQDLNGISRPKPTPDRST